MALDVCANIPKPDQNRILLTMMTARVVLGLRDGETAQDGIVLCACARMCRGECRGGGVSRGRAVVHNGSPDSNSQLLMMRPM